MVVIQEFRAGFDTRVIGFCIAIDARYHLYAHYSLPCSDIYPRYYLMYRSFRSSFHQIQTTAQRPVSQTQFAHLCAQRY